MNQDGVSNKKSIWLIYTMMVLNPALVIVQAVSTTLNIPDIFVLLLGISSIAVSFLITISGMEFLKSLGKKYSGSYIKNVHFL